MQTVSSADLALLAAYNPVHLHLYLDGQEVTSPLGTFSMTAAVGDNEINCGNAIATQVTIGVMPSVVTPTTNTVSQDADGYIVIPTTGDGTDYTGVGGYIVLPANSSAGLGTVAVVTWDVNSSTEYPLFVGQVENITVGGGKAIVTAQDKMFWTGSNEFDTTNYKTTSSAATVFSAIASTMGVSVNSATASLLSGVSITDGFSSCFNAISCSEAAGFVAGLFGGNAVINRSGELAIVRFADAVFDTEAYSGQASATGTDYTPSGVTFQRTYRTETENDDETVSTVDTTYSYTAGNGSIALENPLSDQASATRAYTALSAITSRKGQFSFPMGIHVEPGDVITIRTGDGNYSCAILTQRLEIDGGVKSTVTSGGDPLSGGTSGPVTRQLMQLVAEFAQFRNLVAENASITSANIESLHAGNIDVDALFANDITATGQFNVNNSNWGLTADNTGLELISNVSGGYGYLAHDYMRFTNAQAGRTGETPPFVELGPSSNLLLSGGDVNTIPVRTTTVDIQGTVINLAGAYRVSSDNTLTTTVNVKGNVLPTSSGAYTLGDSSYRWNYIYLTNSPNVSSDRNLKDGIEPLHADDLLNRLKPVRYKLVGSQSDGKVHFGFVAQDVEEALEQSGESPERLGIISFEDDQNGRHGYALAYGEFIPVLTEALQKQQSQIDDLEARIERLERMVLNG